MHDLAKSLTNHSVQSQVRRNMQHVSAFQTPADLPTIMLSKLEELDRAFAEYESKKA